MPTNWPGRRRNALLSVSSGVAPPRIKEDPPEINISFFKTGHWLRGMGHDRGTSLQSGIADAIFQITGKRYRDLPFRNHDLTWS